MENSKMIVQSLAEDRRVQQRETFHLFEDVRIEGSLGNGQRVKLKVLDITAFGAKVELQEDEMTLFAPAQVLSDLKIYFHQEVIGLYDQAQVVHSAQGLQGKYVAGLRFGKKKISQCAPSERRGKFRVRSKDTHTVSASCPHPFRYDDTLHFKVGDISIDGACLMTSPRNRSILNGAVLSKLVFNLPTVGNAEASAEVTDVQYDSQLNQLSIRVKFRSLMPGFSSAFVKYLLAFGDSSSQRLVNEIRSSGFRVKYIKSHIDYSVVSNLADYQRVLELRLQAYSRSGKVDSSATPQSMADHFDHNSVIIIAKNRSRVIGSVRVTYCRSPSDRFELDESIKIPEALNRMKTIEFSRLCVDSDFENTDLVLGLLERCTETGVKMGVTHAITSCVKDMLDFYKRIAFYPTGLTFELQTMNGIPHYFLIHDCRSMRWARKINPLYWLFTYGNVITYFKRFGYEKNSSLPLYKRIFLKIALPLLERKKLRHESRQKK